MQRSLSLVLDPEFRLCLNLKKDEADEIDNFTTKNFESSLDIRKCFDKQIKQFLEENKRYIYEVEHRSGKKFRGRIVVLEATNKNDSLILIEKRVLYKKHKSAFKEMVKDKKTMLKFLEFENIGAIQYGYRRLISQFLRQQITYLDYNSKSKVNFITKELKQKNFYDILRIIVKAYEFERKKRNLPTIEEIYERNKKTKSSNHQSDVDPNEDVEPSSAPNYNKNRIEINGEIYVRVDGVLTPIPELSELEELKRLFNAGLTDYCPDGIEKKHGRTR